MNETKVAQHTPGPWVAANSKAVTGGGIARMLAELETWMILGPDSMVVVSVDKEEDAHLIAAAPALLAALEALMDSDADEHPYADPDLCGAAIGCRRCEVENNARVAIAAAKGGAPQ